jgi:hypothetical protein
VTFALEAAVVVIVLVGTALGLVTLVWMLRELRGPRAR